MRPTDLRHFDLDDVVDLVFGAIDRPLFLAARAVSCSALYYGHDALDRTADVVAGLSAWYDHRAPEPVRDRRVALALDVAAMRVGDARHATYLRWRQVTDYWNARREPVRVSTILAGYRQRIRSGGWGAVTRVA